ncbi:MAG: glycosyltransferase [Bacteroidetes bacterium]|nr:glycosyltransferase [Bacteroidota bacterium]
MKICFVANAESIHTERWVSFFVKNGHEVHLVSHIGRNIEGVIFHKLITIGKSKITTEQIRFVDLLSFFIRAIQTRRIIRKLKPEIVHGHNVILGGFYGSLSRFHPMVVTAWGTDVLIAPNVSVFLKKIAKYVLKNADLLTCDGLNTKDAMVNLGASSEKVSIIYFGIDTKKNHPSQRDEQLREKLNIENSKSLISIRSFNPVYNVETLISAIPTVLSEIPDAKFIIAGTGPGEMDLKELASQLKVEKNIIFTGSLGADDIPKYLASADLYVSTSLSDSGLAASTGEAMACGLPVIVTDVGGNDEWINDGESGYIIPVKSPEILAEKIIGLFKNQELMNSFGNLNRKIIEERQDYYKEMEKMEQICLKLIQDRK